LCHADRPLSTSAGFHDPVVFLMVAWAMLNGLASIPLH
jgi:hypothetical protein